MSSPSRCRPVDPGPPDAGGALGRLLLDLCLIPSVTGAEAAMAEAVREALEGTGMEVERRGHAVAARSPSRGRPTVILAGHLDTVPPVPGAAAPSRAAGRVHGRGAADMKGGLAVMLTLARSLPLDDLPVELGLLFYDREEGPFHENGLEPMLSWVPWAREASLAVLLEPSDGTVQPGCQGSLHAACRFSGRAAHSARPWQGENAIHAAGPLIEALGRLAPRDVELEGLLFRESISATMASGGLARNVIPAEFTVNLNFRFAPNRTLAQAEELLLGFAAEHGVSDVQVVDRAPAGPVVLANPLVERLCGLVGRPPAAKLGWTDVARFAAHGLAAVNYGPGYAAQAHQADEYCDEESLAEVYRVLWGLLAGP